MTISSIYGPTPTFREKQWYEFVNLLETAIASVGLTDTADLAERILDALDDLSAEEQA